MRLTALVLACLLAAVSCRSSKPKRKDALGQPDTAVLGSPDPRLVPGGFYKTKATGFYNEIPRFIDLVPDRYLMRGHVVQLLNTGVGDGWARVKNEKFETGYIRLESIRVADHDERPRPRDRWADRELEARMRSR